MATINDTDLNANTALGTTLVSTNALARATGDLLIGGGQTEGGTSFTLSFNNAAGSGAFTAAGAKASHSNGDLCGQAFYTTAANATATKPEFAQSAQGTFRQMRVLSFTPAGGATWQLGSGAAAPSPTVGVNGTTAGNNGTALTLTPSGPGVIVVFFYLYGSRTITPTDGTFVVPTEFNSSSALQVMYKLVSSGGSAVTCSAAITGGAVDWLAQAVFFAEVDPVAATDPAARSSIVNPLGPLQCGLRR